MYLGSLSINSSYDSVSAVPGKSYTIHFTYPKSIAESLTKDQGGGRGRAIDNYKKFWNQAYISRFEVTSVTVSGDTIVVKGNARTNESFGALGLDHYWDRGTPFYAKTGFMGAWQRNPFRGVNYKQILVDGKDVLESEYELQQKTNNAGGSGAAYTTPAGEPTASSFPVVPVLIGSGLVVTAIVVALTMKKRKA
jgi:hypothetical protein